MKKSNGKINCNVCDKSTDKFGWSKRENKFVECSVCKQRWSKKSHQHSDKQQAHCTDETSALLISGFCSQNFDETVYGNNPKKGNLDHYVFDSMSGWKKSQNH